jgi:hypothetical protein
MHAPANAYACARRLRYATPACQHAPFGRLSARFGRRPHLSAHFALRALAVRKSSQTVPASSVTHPSQAAVLVSGRVRTQPY